MAQPLKQTKISVTNFSITNTLWMGGWEREPAIKDFLSRNQSHLIGMEEVSKIAEDTLRETRPEMKVIFSEPIPYQVGGLYEFRHYNAMAYDRRRFTPVREGTVILNKTGEFLPVMKNDNRAALYVHLVDNAVDRQFLFIVTHPSNKDPHARLEQIRILLKFIDEERSQFQKTFNRELPVIISCDSNINLGTGDPKWENKTSLKPYNQMLESGLKDCFKEVYPDKNHPVTFHGFQGPLSDGDGINLKCLDLILQDGFHTENFVVITESYGGIYASDHYPIMTLLAYPN